MPGPKPLLASPAMAKQVRPYDATRMHNPIAKTGAWLNRMLKGHLDRASMTQLTPIRTWEMNPVGGCASEHLQAHRRKTAFAISACRRTGSAVDRCHSRWPG
jgi:hypothetical protein